MNDDARAGGGRTTEVENADAIIERRRRMPNVVVGVDGGSCSSSSTAEAADRRAVVETGAIAGAVTVELIYYLQYDLSKIRLARGGEDRRTLPVWPCLPKRIC